MDRQDLAATQLRNARIILQDLREHRDLFNLDVYRFVRETCLNDIRRWRKELRAPGPIILTQKEFDDLLEYSCSFPTGTTVGKCWKSHLQNGQWVHRSYQEHPTDDTKVLIVTRDILVKL